MSETTIKALWPGEKNEDFKTLQNSHGSAPVIWGIMCEKYLGAKDRHSYMFDGMINKLWPLWENLEIPKHHRVVLMMTFDRAYVVKEDYKRAAEDIQRFLSDFSFNPDYVNHWPEIAKTYEENPNVPAIGLYCTSVVDDPFQGEWNEEKEEYAQPDWAKCYNLYDEIDELK